jgi:hypothetical protein
LTSPVEIINAAFVSTFIDDSCESLTIDYLSKEFTDFMQDLIGCYIISFIVLYDVFEKIRKNMPRLFPLGGKVFLSIIFVQTSNSIMFCTFQLFGLDSSIFFLLNKTE